MTRSAKRSPPGFLDRRGGGHYFEAMGIPLLRGRLPGDADTERTEPVFIIDEELGRRFWPGEDPIGARVAWRKAAGEKLSGEIVGVVGSVRWGGMAANPQPTTYFWFPQDPRRESGDCRRRSTTAASFRAQRLW